MPIYGIDLGTTNSILCYGDKALTPLVPSVTVLDTEEAGMSVKHAPNAVRSFKVNMSLGTEGKMPIVASSLVLKELVRQSGQDVRDVIISVPAYFTDSQRRATKDAATKAGLNCKGVINEPTAAAIYLSTKQKGLHVVYDLGGGTFDVSIVDSRFDTNDVISTDGTVVGGDNLDKLIRAHLTKLCSLATWRMPPELSNKLIDTATQAKIAIQHARENIIVDMTEYGGGRVEFTEENYIQLMKTAFGNTIALTRALLKSNQLERQSFDILLVGGSTRCPYLREWLYEEFGENVVSLDYDPDYAVALGAGIYAKMVEEGTADIQVSDITKGLSVGLADGTLKCIIPPDSKIPVEDETILFNAIDCSSLEVTLYQSNLSIRNEVDSIGTLSYAYGRDVKAGEGKVVTKVLVKADGTIYLSCQEPLKPEVGITLVQRGN